MRSNIKDFEYYKKFQQELYFTIGRSKLWLTEGNVPLERVNIALDSIRSRYLTSTILQYTFGEDIQKVKDEFSNVLKNINESLVGLWTLRDSKGQEYHQYILSAYDEMLWMLSLGYLLNISDEEFKKIVLIIDKDGVKDYLFEFIIKAKLKNRDIIREESYKDFFGVPAAFDKLRQAILTIDKASAQKLVKEFISNDWYKKQKDAGWYNNHKSEHDAYFGYWSFETAAVVKIMGLDDTEFRNCEFFPKDLL